MSIIEGEFKPEHKLPLADFSVRKATVREVIGHLSRVFGVTFHATSIGVVVTPDGTKPFPNYKAKEGAVFYTYPKARSEQDGGGIAHEPHSHPSTLPSKSRAIPQRWARI